MPISLDPSSSEEEEDEEEEESGHDIDRDRHGVVHVSCVMYVCTCIVPVTGAVPVVG